MTKTEDRWLALVDDYQALPISETAKKHGVSVADLTVNMLRLGVRRTAVVPLGVQTTAELEVERPTAEPASAKAAAKPAKGGKTERAQKARNADIKGKAAKGKAASAEQKSADSASSDAEPIMVNGIACRPNTRDAAIAQHIDQLGRISDPDFAALAGVSARVVAAFRSRHGVAPFQLPPAAKAAEQPAAAPDSEVGGASGRSKIDAFIDMVGNAPDSQVARLAGVGVNAVSNYRRRRGIAPFEASGTGPTEPSADGAAAAGRKPSKIDPFAHLLGTVPDRTVADKAGVSINAVSNYRRRRGVAPFLPDVVAETPVAPAVESPSPVETPAELAAPAMAAARAATQAPPREAKATVSTHVYTVTRRDGSVGYVVGESLLDAARQIDGLPDIVGLSHLGPVLA
jgi:hypothetical protein